MSTAEPTPATPDRPQRGWRRGLLMAGVVLVVALALRERERTAGNPSTVPLTPVVPPRALPADASLSASSQARPRLLALLPRDEDPSTAGLLARLRQAGADRLAIVEGNEKVAKEFGIETLPAFVLYSPTGRELKRLAGPDAVALLLAELRTMGIAAEGIAAETTP